MTGKLEHPNIVAIYEAGRQQLADAVPGDPPAPYYVVRVYRKQTLEKAVEAFHCGPWSEPKLRELVRSPGKAAVSLRPAEHNFQT